MTGPIDTARVEIIPDFSRFGAEVSRGVDSALRGVTADVRTAFGAAERAAADAATEIGRDFQRGGERAEAALREVAGTAQREMAKTAAASEAASASMGSRFKGAFAAIGSGLVLATAAIGAGLAALTGFGLKSAATLEQTQVAFDSLLGSATKGHQVFGDLQKFAAVTPFTFPELTGAAQRFLAFNDAVGLSDDALQPFLTTLGDVASVTGGGAQAMNSVTLAMGQISSAGKVTLDNLNQISEALPGFSGVAAIASATGKTTAQTMDDISSGSLDATTGIQALLKGMATFPGAAGAMEKQSQTLLGVFSTFKDTMGQALVAGFQPVIPAIKGSLAEVTPVLGAAIAQLAPVLGTLVATILPLIASLVQSIVPIIAPIVDALQVGLAILGPALQPLGQALGAISAALAPVIPMVADLAAQLAGELGKALLSVVPALFMLVNSILPVAISIIRPLLPVITKLAAVIGSALTPILRIVSSLFEKLGPPIIKIVEVVAALLMPIFDALTPVIDSIIMALMPFVDILVTLLPPVLAIIQAFMPLTSIIVALLPVVTAILVPLIKLVAILVDFLAQAGLVPLITLIAQALALVLSPLNLLVPVIQSFVAWITRLDWGAIGRAIGGAFQFAWNAVVHFVGDILQRTLAMPRQILSALGNFGSLLYNAGRDLIIGLWNGISAMGGWLWNKVKQFAVDNTIGAFKRALSIGSPSQVAADEVGQPIAQGIGVGVGQGIPDIARMLNTAVSVAGGGASAAAPTLGAAGGIVVNVNFSGVVPTEAEARRTGQAAGEGILAALQRRSVALAVRAA